ncbi:hypothetical protein M885DRAFT_520672 [Pelagophyceae sp. CCMP2097]|nr:hypothetical protein M885DRAFT_520672 [Pelagophyceae sp. CCMP2097]
MPQTSPRTTLRDAQRMFRSVAATLRIANGVEVAQMLAHRYRTASAAAAFARWVAVVRAANADRMNTDSAQWTLHAKANASKDLQAWYHATFAAELYRLRGAFWWKEAILPEYASHPVNADETAAEPAGTKAHSSDAVLCSPHTIYTAMAATMYTIRAALSEAEYALFERLTTDGVMVLKHPFKAGRPQKKRFQLSLVQGDMYLYMYLTWKGKRGMQGIELASVTAVVNGNPADSATRQSRGGPEAHLQLVMPDRVLDLCYDADDECALWQSCLGALVRIENDVRAAAKRDAPDAAAEPSHLAGDDEDRRDS